MKFQLVILVACFAATEAFLKFGPWNKRKLVCMLKEGTLITSPTIRSWKVTTQGSIGGLSCAAAHERVRSRCNVNLNTKYERQRICNSQASQVPVWPSKKIVKVTKMGKADCMAHVAHNFWKDENHQGIPRVTEICCTKFSPYPWVPVKVHCCDPVCY